MKKIFNYFIVFAIIFVAASPFIFTKKDIVIKENSEWKWVKSYDFFNSDSTIYKIHKPITYDGVVSKVVHNTRMVCKMMHNYEINTVVYGNNKTYSFETEYTPSLKEGQHVKVTEVYSKYGMSIKIENN